MMTTEQQLAIALDALNEISNPVKYMILRLKPDERIVGEKANALADSANYLRQIANDARHAIASDDPNVWYRYHSGGDQ